MCYKRFKLTREKDSVLHLPLSPSLIQSMFALLQREIKNKEKMKKNIAVSWRFFNRLLVLLLLCVTVVFFPNVVASVVYPNHFFPWLTVGLKSFEFCKLFWAISHVFLHMNLLQDIAWVNYIESSTNKLFVIWYLVRKNHEKALGRILKVGGLIPCW